MGCCFFRLTINDLEPVRGKRKVLKSHEALAWGHNMSCVVPGQHQNVKESLILHCYGVQGLRLLKAIHFLTKFRHKPWYLGTILFIVRQTLGDKTIFLPPLSKYWGQSYPLPFDHPVPMFMNMNFFFQRGFSKWISSRRSFGFIFVLEKGIQKSF